MFSSGNYSRTYLLFLTISGAPIFCSSIYGQVLEKKSKLKTNNFCKERPNTQHYCIIIFFGRKLFKNIPLPFNWTMIFLVNPWQISFIACHQWVQFSGVATFSFVSSSTLDLFTWSLFFISNALGFVCFLQGLLVLAFEKLQQNEKKTQLSLT
jgi:hypothetical protein